MKKNKFNGKRSLCMKNKAKRILALLMALTLLVPVGMLAANADVSDITSIPTVYVVGQGTSIYNADGEVIAPVNEPEGYLSDALDACLKPFVRSLVAGNETDIAAYQDLLYSWLAPLYDDARMDNNGDPAEGDYVGSYPGEQMAASLRNNKTGSGYKMRAYNFLYDWRVDPVSNAAVLHQYIENVKRSTGFSKVNLVGRCEGSTIVMAYLAEYGHDSVQNLYFLMPAYNGLLLISQLFSNHVKLDSYAASTWMQAPDGAGLDNFPEGELIEFFTSIVDMAAATYGVDVVNAVVMPMYQKMIEGVLPRILLSSYATMPGMWAMVSDRDFDDAIKFVFNGCEDEYAALISRVKYYRENVKYKTEEILQACLDDGIRIANVTKYGYPSAPLFEESRMLSDGGSTVYDVSFGATAADTGKTLTEKYISDRTAEGKGKYISPDKLIDASTGFLPDTTWYFGNLPHPETPDWVDSFMGMFFNEDITVDSYAQYPQFLVYEGPKDNYNNGRMVPLTVDNSDSSLGFDPEPDFGSGFSKFFSMVQTFLARIINWVRSFIDGIINHAKG